MSVQNEIQRISTAKTDIRNSIKNKGVDIASSVSITNYPEYIQQLPTLQEYQELQEKVKNLIYLV